MLKNTTSPEAFRLGFRVCMVAAGVIFAICILSVFLYTSGSANVSHLNFHINGDADVSTSVGGSSTRAMVKGADMDLKSNIDTIGPNMTQTYKVIITGAGGTLYDRVETIFKGAGDTIISKEVGIYGDLDGEFLYGLKKTPGGKESLDSTIRFNTSHATITMRIWNASTGRPANELELDAVGNATIELVQNVSSPEEGAKIVSDWLAGCAAQDRDNILDTSAGGVYVAPEGYDLINGKLVPNQTKVAEENAASIPLEDARAYDITNETGRYQKNGAASTYHRWDGSMGTAIDGIQSIEKDSNGNLVKMTNGPITGTGDGKGGVNWVIS